MQVPFIPEEGPEAGGQKSEGSRDIVTTTWDDIPKAHLDEFRRKLGHPSRSFIWSVLRDGQYKNMLEGGLGGADVPAYIVKYNVAIDYMGIDVTPAFVDNAAGMFNDPRFMFGVGDIQALDFKDGTFDLVYTRHTVEHLKHYEAAVRELFRVARERVIIVLFHKLKKKDVIQYKKKKRVYSNYYGRDKFTKLLQSLCRKVKLYGTMNTNKFSGDIIVDCLI